MSFCKHQLHRKRKADCERPLEHRLGGPWSTGWAGGGQQSGAADKICSPQERTLAGSEEAGRTIV